MILAVPVQRAAKAVAGFVPAWPRVGWRTTWRCCPGGGRAWGLFEWRVRSENKPFMRLSALGTAALGLTVGLVVVATAVMVVAFARG